MKKETLIKIVVLLSVVATIVVNILANALPINGLTTKELSDAIPIYFVPAGYVFSIWGVIYLGLIYYSIFLFKKFEKVDEEVFPWFILSSLANISWIVLWHYQKVALSVIPMILLLLSLLMIYSHMDNKNYTKLKRIPFQIYLGWISVATIANIASALHIAKFSISSGIPEEIWAVVMIGVATMLSILMTSIKNDIFYPLVIIWAVTGILIHSFSLSDIVTGASMVSIISILINLFANTYCKKETITEKK